MLASLSARSNAAAGSTPHAIKYRAERRTIADRQALAEFGDKDPA